MAIKRLMAKKAINQASRQGKAIGKGAKEVAEKVAKESAEKAVKEGAESAAKFSVGKLDYKDGLTGGGAAFNVTPVNIGSERTAKAATNASDDGVEYVKKMVNEARNSSPVDAINSARDAVEEDVKRKIIDDVKAEGRAEDISFAGAGASNAKAKPNAEAGSGPKAEAKAEPRSEPKAEAEPKKVSERGRKYMKSKFNKSMKYVDDIYGGATQLDDEALGGIQRQFRFGDDDMDALRAASGNKEQMKTLIRSREDKYVQSYNMMDAAMAHKVPQIAAGAIGTSWLVQNMSNNRGRQSNAQLYNQR